MAPATSDRADQALWSLSDLDFGYGERMVLQRVSLELVPGRCYGILGPNGSGKTTLLDLLSGLLQPHAGRVTFRGRPLHSWPKKQLARRQLQADVTEHHALAVAEVQTGERPQRQVGPVRSRWHHGAAVF